MPSTTDNVIAITPKACHDRRRVWQDILAQKYLCPAKTAEKLCVSEAA